MGFVGVSAQVAMGHGMFFIEEDERLKRMSGVLKKVLQSIWMLVLQSIKYSVVGGESSA